MDEDIKTEPMKPMSETLQEVLERLDGNVRAEDPCPHCNGTGTELINDEGYTRSRRCRHFA